VQGESKGVDELLSEARARIIWGESPVSVHDFLTSNGISEVITNSKLAEFNLERSKELRKLGLRSVMTGAVLISAASITIYLWLPFLGGVSYAVGLVGIAGIYGVWKLAIGIAYLVRPQCERRSMPDIASSEMID
jgi:hypothetical protein